MEYWKEKILSLYSKVILSLEQAQSSCSVDQLFESTYGSIVWSIVERFNITQTYLSTCEELGDYNHLKKVSEKFKSKVRSDAKDTQNGEPQGRRSATAAQQKQSSGTKNVNRKIHKKICVSILKALLTCVNALYKSHLSPIGNSTMLLKNLLNYSIDAENPKSTFQPLLTLASKDELPELLRETFEIYNKFTHRGEVKKHTTQYEKDILYECVFKMRCIYDGMKNHRYLDLSDNSLKLQGAEECAKWFNALKNDHESARKEQISKDEQSKKSK